MRSRKDRFPLLRVLPQALQVYTKYNKPPASLLANAGAIIGTDPMKTLANNGPWLLLSFVLLGAAMSASNAKAETSIHLGGWSKHLVTGNDNDYTSSHDLFAVEVGPVLVARFRNSYGRESYAAGYGWSRKWGNWEGLVYMGVVRGYKGFYGNDEKHTKTLPMALPSIRYTKYRVQPGLLLLGEALVLEFGIVL